MSDSVSFLINVSSAGAPAFEIGNTYAVESRPADVVIADFNGDNMFEPRRSFAVGNNPKANRAADLDGDGHTDLAVANTAGGNLTILLNACGDAAPCPADLDGNAVVGVGDLLALLAIWGTCDDCAADFDDNGEVGVSDLLALLAAWGACP